MAVPGRPEYCWFGVFDGHGGSLVAKQAAEHLLKFIQETKAWKEDSTSIESLKSAIRQGFIDFDQKLREVRRGAAWAAGAARPVARAD